MNPLKKFSITNDEQLEEAMEDPDFFDYCYEYYQTEMPYGVMKARSGDPHEWIHNRLYAALDQAGF